MPVALSARDLSKTYGSRTLFTGVALSLEDRERLALIGPNGSGKSTLLKILAGLEVPDTGSATTRKGLRTAYVSQTDTFPDNSTILTAVEIALNDARREGKLPHLHDDHEVELAAEQSLYRVGFDDLTPLTSSLSGGQRKRLSIARELAKEPDVLLLDEPTNHLDVEGILWLESLIRSSSFASIVVTHDRTFLENIASRIVELSTAYPEGTFSVDGNYSEFLRRKSEFLEGQAKQQQTLANTVREDLRWLGRGAQARRTKSKSRIDASYERMDELEQLKARNMPLKAAGIDFTATERKTQKLLVARAITKAYGERKLFTDLDLVLSPGDILGLMGPNGSGKSTLIKVLTGEIDPDPPTPAALAHAKENPLPSGAPDPGEIRRADKLKVVVFSQHRTELDLSENLGDALTGHSDGVTYRGRQMHVNSWAKRFLFTPQQLIAPVRALSGGEQARVHIARLMLEPADILILDEPTNDLDIPSLEILEENLEEFPGSIVLVTHDRAMLSRLATRILALDGRGSNRYFADYDQWERIQREQSRAATQSSKPAAAVPSAAPAPTKKKLTYNEQRELAEIEPGIEQAEKEVKELEAAMNDPDVMADHKKLQDVCGKLGTAQARVAALYARWSELDAKR